MLRLSAFLLAAALCAQPAPDFSALDKTATAEMKSANVPGAAIAIVQGGKVIYERGYGVASVETGAPITPDMLFRLGSTTKMFTAAALVGLAVEGKLTLDHPVGKYIAGLPPKLAAITASQLLSHTAGVRDEAPMNGLHDEDALGKRIRSMNEDWLFTAPGRVFSYSNPGYWFAGYLAEVIGGKHYADVLDQRLFQPLGMQRTTLRPLVAMTYPLAQGHDFMLGKTSVIRPAADNAESWPAGSIFSSVEDLSRFVIAFLNDGRIDGKQALDPRIIKELSTEHAQFYDSPGGYGYGLMLENRRGVPTLRHGGSRSGYGSGIVMAPQQRAAVIVVANRSGASLPKTTEQALESLLPLKPREPEEPKTALPLDPADFAKYTGIYRNGNQNTEITVKNGKLTLEDGGRSLAIERIGEHRFRAAGGPEFVLVPGNDGKAAYLTVSLRALARQ